MAMTQFTGMEYLMMDVASNFGLSKKTWGERLDWFKANEGQLESLIKKAEEPALFFAGVRAYRKAKLGEAVSYPISLDGTSSGLQILACLTGDRKAAMICNVLDNNGQRMDAYRAVYEHMLAALGKTATIVAKAVKQAVMTALYGSTAVPRETFGEDTPELEQFYRSMETLAPASWELNTFFLNIWDPEAYMNAWVLPDNFNVQVKVMATIEEQVQFLGKTYTIRHEENMPIESGRSLGANVTHSVDGLIVREMTRRCDYDPLRISHVRQALKGEVSDLCPVLDEDMETVEILWKHYLDSGFLSARILNHLHWGNMHIVDVDVIQEMVDSLPAKPFKILCIHDCFRCLPNYANDMRKQYNLQLQLIAKSNMLSFILSQLLGQTVPIAKFDPDMWKDIPESEYAIC